jgi:excisionase family DNA binding protein
MSGLLTAEEVRELLKVKNVVTIYRWASSGRLPRIVLGPRSIRFRPEDVEAFIAGQRQEAAK